MIKIKIIAVGKVKDFYKAGCEEYLKRLSSNFNVHIIEVNDEKINDNPSEKEILNIINKESKKILEKIKKEDYNIVLDLRGKEISSINFAKMIQEKVNTSTAITFIIGGSYGLSEEIIKNANYNLKLSEMTFPHQLARVLLLEQLFRAMKINNNSTYHK